MNEWIKSSTNTSLKVTANLINTGYHFLSYLFFRDSGCPEEMRVTGNFSQLRWESPPPSLRKARLESVERELWAESQVLAAGLTLAICLWGSPGPSWGFRHGVGDFAMGLRPGHGRQGRAVGGGLNLWCSHLITEYRWLQKIAVRKQKVKAVEGAYYNWTYYEFLCDSNIAKNPRIRASVLLLSIYVALAKLFNFSEP